MEQVVIIGSGISGLSTAFRLRKEGVKPVIFEKEEEIGGNIKTVKEGSYILELGPQTVLADSEVREFMRDAGLEPLEAKPESKNRYIYRDGRLIPLPMNPLSFLTSPLISFGAKLRVLREPWAPPPFKSEETIGDFVRRRLGEEFLTYIVGPFVSGVYAGDPDQLSVKYATRKIYQLEREHGSLIKGAIKKKAIGPGGKLVSFKEGLFTLVRNLAKDIEVKLQNVVLRIRRKDDRFILDTREGKVECRCLVVSSPAYTASYLLKDLSWSASLEFDKIDYVPVVVLHLSVPEGTVPEGFGFLVPRNQNIRILGVIFSSKLFESRAPEGKDLLTVYMGGATDREILNLSDEEIGETALRELKNILKTDNLEILKITRWKRAIPQYTLGYGKYLELAREMEKDHPGLFLTGNYLGGVSVADCIRHSKEVSERVIRFLEG